MRFHCIKCSFLATPDSKLLTCPHHSQYYSYFEVIDGSKDFFTLFGEGNTPLIQADNQKVYIKDESKNPSGTIKDREVAGIFKFAINQDIKEVAMVSAGNGARSAGYYAKKAGIKLHCFVSKKTAKDNIEFLEQQNAIVHLEDGDYEEIFKKVIDTNPFYNITPGINPLAEEGTKFIAHELGTQNFEAVIVPVGNGTQLAGIWKGFKELGLKNPPKMIGVEIEGCDPIYQALQSGIDFVELDSIPDSKATGIAARCAFSSPKAIKAIRESNGMIVKITEAELENAITAIASEPIIRCGDTSASVFAGLQKIEVEGNIVCIMSGNR